METRKKKSEFQMGFEPTTLRDLVSEFPFDVNKPYHVVISKTRLDGWMVASLICLNVTARCSYESYVPYWFDYVTA